MNRNTTITILKSKLQALDNTPNLSRLSEVEEMIAKLQTEASELKNSKEYQDASECENVIMEVELYDQRRVEILDSELIKKVNKVLV